MGSKGTAVGACSSCQEATNHTSLRDKLTTHSKIQTQVL